MMGCRQTFSIEREREREMFISNFHYHVCLRLRESHFSCIPLIYNTIYALPIQPALR